MPHFERVTNLFRSSTENHNLSAVKTSLFSHTSNSLDRMHSSTVPEENDEDSEHHDPDEEDAAGAAQTASPPSRLASLARMHSDPENLHKKRRRRHFPFVWSGKEKGQPGPAVLDCVLESPPVVFHGTSENSTGALVSGQLVLEVMDERLEVDNLQASIVVRVVQKSPFQGHCAECGMREVELKQWSFLRHPVTLSRGIHKIPFTHLLEGSNPASTETPTVSITYHLKAEAIVARYPFTAGSSVTPLRLELPLPVRRCLPEPDLPHHSIRVFPPTDIRASAHYSQVLHPTGKNSLTVSLDGLSSKVKNEDVIECWRLKKVSWRLEESVRTVARACERHSEPTSEQEGDEERNRVVRTRTRVLGEQNVPPTWKAEYSATTGHADLEFDFSLQAPRQHHLHQPSPDALPPYACDVSMDGNSPTGTEVTVTHSLMLELVVSRVRAAISQPDVATETGTGRILRMRFRVYLSEAGEGVAWDDEAPPLYEDVPPSPPGYEGEGEEVISVRGSEEGSGEGMEIYAARSSADGV